MKAIAIAGRVGKDAQTRTTQNGDKVASFTVAVDEGFGDKKRTLWFDVSYWGKRGEAVAPYVRKGGNVSVTGEFSTREYEGKTHMTIRANDITLQGGKSDGGSGGSSYTEHEKPQRRELDDDLDSIPF